MQRGCIESLSPIHRTCNTKAVNHGLLLSFPALPLCCLLFAISTAVTDRRQKLWLIVSFSLLLAVLVVSIISVIHHLYSLDTHQRRAHGFIILPFILSLTAFALCVVPFRFLFRPDDPPPRWFSALLSVPIGVLALVFSLLTSFLLWRDQTKCAAVGQESPR